MGTAHQQEPVRCLITICPSTIEELTYLVHRLERQPERTLPESGLREVRLPQQVRVAEHKLDRLLGLGRVEAGSADYTARADDVEGDLDVERPVPRVVEDEYRGDGDIREVDGLCNGGARSGSMAGGGCRRRGLTFVDARSSGVR